MGSMQPAVLEFDEAVQVPWRPPLGAASLRRGAHLRPAPVPAPVRPGQAGPTSTAPRRPGARPGGTRRAAGEIPSVPLRRAAAQPARRPGADRRVRLTRRGRWLLVVLSLALGIALGALLGSWLGGGSIGLRLASESSVVVRSGDTLWSIATSVSGSEDVRAVIDRIRQLNHLSGTALRPGQVLQLP